MVEVFLKVMSRRGNGRTHRSAPTEINSRQGKSLGLTPSGPDRCAPQLSDRFRRHGRDWDVIQLAVFAHRAKHEAAAAHVAAPDEFRWNVQSFPKHGQ